MALEFIEFSQDRKQEWDSFVDDSSWGDVLQFWGWGDTKRSENWTPHRFGVVADGEILVVAQGLIKDAPYIGRYLYVPHGPVFHSKDALESGIGKLKEGLLNFAKENNIFAIEIEPKLGFSTDERELPKNIQPFVDKEIFKILQDHGFRKTGRNVQPVYKLLYDLEMEEEEILGLMKSNTRYNVRYAQRKGVVAKEYAFDSEEANAKLEKFYSLLEETQQRADGYPIRPYSTFESLLNSFQDKGDTLVFTEVSFEGDVIAINISERTKNWSSSFYAGSNRLHPKVKAMYLLRWTSVQSAKAYGSKVYDFWGIIPDSEQHKGYSDNKLSFGGYRIDHYGLLALPVKPLGFFVWDKLLPLSHKVKNILRSIKP